MATRAYTRDVFGCAQVFDMRVVNIHGPGDFRVDAAPEPKAGPRDVVIKIDACGVCGTDLTFIKLGGTGMPGGPSPMPLGHEAAGVIVELGAEVQGLTLGMKVIINPMATTDVIGNGGPEGAFSDYLLVRDAVLNRGVWPVPAGMPQHIAALTEPMSVARHGVNRAAPTPASKCVVFGVGPIGLGAILWLKRRGVENVVAVDVSDERLEKAHKLGAKHTIVAGKENLFAQLTKYHGSGTSVIGPGVGTDIFLDFAGAPTVIADVLDVCKQGATLMIVGIHPKPELIDLQKLVVKEVSVFGSCGYPNEYGDVIADLVAMGADAEHLISHRFPIDEFPRAIDAARSRASAKVMVEF